MRARTESASERLVTMLTDLAEWNEGATFSLEVLLDPVTNTFRFAVVQQAGADRTPQVLVDAADTDRLWHALADKLGLWGTRR